MSKITLTCNAADGDVHDIIMIIVLVCSWHLYVIAVGDIAWVSL